MDKKQKIIECAANLMHEYGYNNLGIKKILDEVQIPKGSFYYYFESKEDLALNIIEYHIQHTQNTLSQFDKSIEGLKGFFNVYFQMFEEMGFMRGCPIGNLILELADIKESFRTKLLQWSEFLEEEIFQILQRSNVDKSLDCKALASFIVSNFEGTILKAKLEKNSKPIEEFNYFIFEILLKTGENKNGN